VTPSGPEGADPSITDGTVLPLHREGEQWAGRGFLAPPPVSAGLRLTYDASMLDERDLDIIAALQEDARATYTDIAKRVGLSASSVHDRVRKLEQGGVIRAYRAEVDPEAIGLLVTALISVLPLDPTQPDDLPDRVTEFREVEDCFSVAGEANYVLKVRTRTPAHLEDLIRHLREKAGVQTRTTVVLSTPFEGRPLRP